MKKAKTWITSALCIIIALPFLALAAVYFGLLISFDYIRYKKSFYYKNERQKYSLLVGTNENFKIYNEVAKCNLPIQYVKHPEESFIENGWFAYGKTLFITNYLDFEYDEHRGLWTSWNEDEDGKKVDIMLLDQLIEIELQEKNELLGGNAYENAVVWISVESLSDIEKARKEVRFLIYEKDRKEVLRCFCERR